MKNISIFVLLILLLGCETEKNERIFFVRISPAELYSEENKPELYVCRYIEYNSLNHNQLKVAKSVGRYYESENKTIPKFGLDRFYTYKLNTKTENALRNLFSTDYQDSYYRQITDGIDDRGMEFIIIEKGNEVKRILYEYGQLPVELKKIDRLINDISNSSTLISSPKNISEIVLKNLQDSLFKHNPPPPRLKSTIKFVAPTVNEK